MLLPLRQFSTLSPGQQISTTFGSGEISTLAEAFQAQLLRTATAEELPSDCQVEEQLREEWEDYLDLVGPASRRPQSFTELMSRLRTGRKRFPLLYLLAQIVDVLPAHTACVERGFSLLNRLKDKKRASLDEGSLQDCMAICSNGVPLEEWSKRGTQSNYRVE